MAIHAYPTPTHCQRYWDLADHIRINDAIALWCGVEPAQLASLNFETQCMSANRAALVAALRSDRPVINKVSLRRRFEQLPFGDRPAFLFDEARQAVLPDGSDAAEMNSLRSIAVMGHLPAHALWHTPLCLLGKRRPKKRPERFRS